MLDKRGILRQGFAASLLWVTLLALTHPAVAQHYVQQNLVSDLAAPPGGAPKILDPDLLNPWGVAYGPGGPFWVANQGNGKATIYTVDGTTGAISKSSFVVTIPASLVGQPSGPTALISINPPTGDFPIFSGTHYSVALFLFSALNGTISGWNPDLPPPGPSTVAQLAVTGFFPPVNYT